MPKIQVPARIEKLLVSLHHARTSVDRSSAARKVN